MENRCKLLVLSLLEDFSNTLSSCIFELKCPWSLDRQNKASPALASRTGTRRAGPGFGPGLTKGWQSHGRVLGEVMGGFNPLLRPPALLRGPVLQPLPPRPIRALGKDVTISPHISPVLPDISKALFPGHSFRREITFHSQILPYCPRSGIEGYACSHRAAETCPRLECLILILKESLTFTMQIHNL